jgi:agmatinase
LQNTSLFLSSQSTVENAAVVLFGIPMDYTVCFRPGARFGPAAIRQASYGLEKYSLQFGDSIQNRAFFDAGDLVLPFGNPDKSLEMAEAFSRDVIREDRCPFALGGEHLVSLPVIRAVFERYPDLRVIHIDAHADLADTYFGEAVTHATVMRRVLDFLPHEQFAQFGIRSADRPEVEFAKHLEHHPFQVAAPLARYLETLHPDVPIYVTLDVDVLDPAYAPGTGTPEAGGITPVELFDALALLRGRRVVGADLVEVAPQLDPSGCTAVLGAKLVREMLLTLFAWTADEATFATTSVAGRDPAH